jgi:Trk K+ transport system NAD-binding subunit
MEPLKFFDFVVPGAILAGTGFIYVLVLLPKFLPDRDSLASQLVGDEKEFVAELDIVEDSPLIGMEYADGHFPKLEDLKIKLIQRSGHLILPPFEGYQIKANDILIVAATRKTLGALLAKYPGFLLSEEESQVLMAQKTKTDSVVDDDDEIDEEQKDQEEIVKPANLEEKVAETRMLAEIMITPASRMIDMSLDHVSMHRQFGVIVLGIQRRARVVRRRLGRIRLEAGDVLLVTGTHAAINSMRNNQDLIVLSGSKDELPVPKKAPIAASIMIGAISLAAVGVLSIPVAAIAGAVLMIATDCLNVRQATRAIDRKIFLLVGSMLALGTALQVTDGALFIAEQIETVPFAHSPFGLASLLFILVAICTNILSNNACAILFTPIAMNLALNVNVDPVIFAMTVVFAANCSFASPIGYKTNLLVMGPGHYRFRDFVKSGVPLVLMLWAVYMLLAKFYYHL